MQYSVKSCCALFVLAGIELLFNVSCGRAPSGVGPAETGGIEIQVQLADGMAKVSRSLKTAFDTLVVEVTGEDIQPIRCVSAINPAQHFLIDTLPAIPTGGERKIMITTINQSGEIIHEDSCGERTVRVEPGVVTVLQAVLLPVRGSIYLQIGSVPTGIDSMGAVFTSGNNTRWMTSSARSPKVFLCIDNIPNNTQGVLMVAGFTSAGDTLYRARADVKIDSRSLNNVQLSFVAVPGGLALQGTLQLPGATVVSGSMGGTTVASRETGALVITEVMYAVNDSEYIEFYNPSTSDAAFDSLYVEIDGSKRLFTGVTVGPHGYYVVGRQQMAWADAYHPVKSALDLSSNGNWITLLGKDGSVLDQVVFTGGSNQLEWPKVTGKASICLNGEALSSAGNNFGRNWQVAANPIDGAPVQMGSPHAL